LDDAGVHDLRQRRGPAAEALDVFRLGLGEHLDGDEAVQRGIDGAVDGAHAAGAEHHRIAVATERRCRLRLGHRGPYIATSRRTECASAHTAQAASAAYRAATVGKKTKRSNQAVIAHTRSDWMCRREKLAIKSPSATRLTRLPSQPGRPASATSATTHSQYCGETTWLAWKKTHIRPQEARSEWRRRVTSWVTASSRPARRVTTV